MKRLLLVLAASFCGVLSYSQLLTWTPSLFSENNAAQTLVITMDAAKGNQGLLNYSSTTDVYVHIGVITNKSTSSSDWKYVKFAWATTSSAANAVYVGNNKWTYTGNLRTFFGITDATETIQKIAILFRNGAGYNNRVQRNVDGSDVTYGPSPLRNTYDDAAANRPAANNLELQLLQSGKATVQLYNGVGQPLKKMFEDVLNNGT